MLKNQQNTPLLPLSLLNTATKSKSSSMCPKDQFVAYWWVLWFATWRSHVRSAMADYSGFVHRYILNMLFIRSLGPLFTYHRFRQIHMAMGVGGGATCPTFSPRSRLHA